ncbi:MAG: hypothetical protein JW765_12320 [Deltaproteobacteria bacterium]|nr:hypothetical protein [Candidatus Zymogenaceae bacterium]
MKRIIIVLSVLFIMVSISSCKSGPQVYAPPPVTPVKYRTVFIDFVYDPVFPVTHDERTRVVEDLQSRMNGMGFAISTSQDRADMLLTITIDDLELARRNDRLVARTTFGLAKDAAFMVYTASFVDNRTLDEIVSKNGKLKTTKYFPSKEEIKTTFFSEMEDEILEFISESKAF